MNEAKWKHLASHQLTLPPQALPRAGYKGVSQL